jgi:hypothetical protein
VEKASAKIKTLKLYPLTFNFYFILNYSHWATTNMTIERNFTSGTGNGIDAFYYKEFVDALNKEIKFLQLFVEHYKKTGAEKMFGSNQYALNNWHGEYKIESYADEKFPFEMVNRVGFNCWGDIELAVVIPMKFKAKSWGGSEVDDMKAVFKTHANVRNLKEFIKNYTLCPHILKEVLLAAQEYYKIKIDQYKKDKNDWIEQKIKKLKNIAIENIAINSTIQEDIQSLKDVELLLNK